MTPLRRALGTVTLLGLGITGLTACSEADTAVATAPECARSSASPEPERHEPGQAFLIGQVIRSSLPPGPVPGWERVVSVADTGTALAAVHPDGTVSVVGVNHEGSLAGTSGGAEETVRPHRVPSVTDAVSVAGVGSSFIVTHSDGTVTSWGDSFIANGGDRDDSRDETVPEKINKVEDVVSVTSGPLAAYALRSDGKVQGWGLNITENLGNPKGTAVRTIEGVRGARSLADANGAVVIANGDGHVCAWGNNSNGLLGVEPRGGQTGDPVRIEGLENVVQVAGGHDYAMALDTAGEVRAWGRTGFGSLGNGTDENTAISTPRVVPGLPPLRWIGASEGTAYGIDESGKLWSWGSGPRQAPYEIPDSRAHEVPLPGPAQTVAGIVVLLEPAR